MSDPLAFLAPALTASLAAGEAILKVYRSSDPGVTLKDDHSPLTRADQEAHHIIAGSLTPTGLPLLSEEGRTIPYDERKGWGDFWLVDPLDGTKEFLKRNGEFTVNVALIREGRPVLGVVLAPALSSIHYGVQGKGAFKIDLGSTPTRADALLPGKGRAVPIPPENAGKPGFTRVVASRSHLSPETKAFIDGLEGTVDLLSSGSSLKFCLVAEGKAEVYPRFAPTMEWDTAAGQAVVEAGGGKVVDSVTGEPLRYNKEDLRNPFFVARRA